MARVGKREFMKMRREACEAKAAKFRREYEDKKAITMRIYQSKYAAFKKLDELPKLQCRRCGEQKNLSEFYVAGDKPRTGRKFGTCEECVKIRYNKYCVKNEKIIALKSRKYRKENKEKIIENDRRYRTLNREEIKAKRATLYLLNRPEILKQRKEYYIKNGEKIRHRMALKRKRDKNKK